MDNYIILDARWFSPVGGQVGIVAIRTGLHDPLSGEWKAYIGLGLGVNIEQDEQYIAAWGAPLQPEEAQGFFPSLDIARYKQDK